MFKVPTSFPESMSRVFREFSEQADALNPPPRLESQWVRNVAFEFLRVAVGSVSRFMNRKLYGRAEIRFVGELLDKIERETIPAAPTFADVCAIAERQAERVRSWLPDFVRADVIQEPDAATARVRVTIFQIDGEQWGALIPLSVSHLVDNRVDEFEREVQRVAGEVFRRIATAGNWEKLV